MFSSKSKDSPAPATTSSPAPQPKRAAGTRPSAPSIISSDLVVNGTLSSSGDIQIDGRIEGDVHSAGLVIGEKALIHGEVLADDVTVRGRVQGSIRARKVLLCASCHVEGNILHEAFAVEAGAFFEGNCRHSDNPLAPENAQKPAEALRKPAAPVTLTNSMPPPGTNGGGMMAAKAMDVAAAAARPAAAPLKPNA